MNVYIKEAVIIDPTSSYHNQKVGILIKNGILEHIGSDLNPGTNYKHIALPNLHISSGWFDSSVSFGEPGFEERETLSHGLSVASNAGFTHIALQPDVLPVADHSSAIAFMKAQSRYSASELHPIGALTKGLKGEELAELYDMYQMGAVAFGDYKKAVKNPNLLKLALQYTQSFKGLVQSFPLNKAIAGNGVMNEGTQSTLLGLKGIPALAEELQIQRDLFILEYTGGHLHIPTISTKKGVDLITKAKQNGLNVTCSVALCNLLLDDQLLNTYDTRYKVLPPLRSSQNVEALREALTHNHIDMITSDHRPVDIENKKTEFEYSAYGTVGLEHSFTSLNHHFDLETTIKYLTAGKQIFNIDHQPIEKGNHADLSLFDPDGSFTITTKHILSTSKNSAFLGQKAKGKVYGIYHKSKLHLA